MASYLNNVLRLIKSHRESSDALKQIAGDIEVAHKKPLNKIDARVILKNQNFISFFVEHAPRLDRLFVKAMNEGPISARTATNKAGFVPDLDFRFVTYFNGMEPYVQKTAEMYGLLVKINAMLKVFRRKLKVKNR